MADFVLKRKVTTLCLFVLPFPLPIREAKEKASVRGVRFYPDRTVAFGNVLLLKLHSENEIFDAGIMDESFAG